MAKKNRSAGVSAEDAAKAFGTDIKFKSYRNDGQGFDDFEEGQEIIGTLVSIRDHNITDRRTKQPKDIRVYSIRVVIPKEEQVEGGPTDKVLKIGGRTILDRMFDDIMDENGGFSVDNKRYSGKGYEYLQDRIVKMNRGDDTETADGNPLGTYEIAVESD